jgi:hypothetical protein
MLSTPQLLDFGSLPPSNPNRRREFADDKFFDSFAQCMISLD